MSLTTRWSKIHIGGHHTAENCSGTVDTNGLAYGIALGYLFCNLVVLFCLLLPVKLLAGKIISEMTCNVSTGA